MSFGLLVLLCLLPAVLGQGTAPTAPSIFQTFFNSFRASMNAFQSVVNGGLGLVNRTMAGGAFLVNSTSSALTTAGRGLVSSVVRIKSTGLQAGANATNAGLGMLRNFTSPIPLVGPMVNAGVAASQAGVDLVNRLGQAGIGAFHSAKNATFDTIDRVVQACCAVVQAGTAMKVNMIQGLVNSTSNAINSALGNPSTPASATQTTASATQTTPASATQSTPATSTQATTASPAG